MLRSFACRILSYLSDSKWQHRIEPTSFLSPQIHSVCFMVIPCLERSQRPLWFSDQDLTWKSSSCHLVNSASTNCEVSWWGAGWRPFYRWRCRVYLQTSLKRESWRRSWNGQRAVLIVDLNIVASHPILGESTSRVDVEWGKAWMMCGWSCSLFSTAPSSSCQHSS